MVKKIVLFSLILFKLSYSMQKSCFELIPQEVQLNILSYVAQDDVLNKVVKNLINISSICRELRNLVQDDIFLKSLKIDRFSNIKDIIQDIFVKAVKEKSFNLIKILVYSGADINAVGAFHEILNLYTALTFAARHDMDDMFDYLIELGADINNLDGSNQTPLMISIANKSEKIFELLISKKNINFNVTDEYGRTALMQAIDRDRKNIVDLLIKAGADVNIQDKSGYTALIEAISKGNKDVIDLLIKAGADINIKEKNQWFYVLVAEKRNYKQVVDLFISKKIDIDTANFANFSKNTVLLEAASAGCQSIVSFLIDSGADVNKQNFKGNTALMAACYNGHKEVVNILIKANADIKLVNREGKTAAIIAQEKGYVDIVASILKS